MPCKKAMLLKWVSRTELCSDQALCDTRQARGELKTT